MDPDLASLLTETVLQTSYAGLNDYGVPTYGSPVSRPAKIEERVATVGTSQGMERVLITVVFLDGDVPVQLQDRLTLPSGAVVALQRLQTVRDETGAVDHYRVEL